MSDYYKANRTRNLFDPKSETSFKLSRSKIELFLECPRCFYLDRRLGVGRPPGFPFNLNSAVDKLLKKEFDIHRAKNEAHPLMKKYGIGAVPAAHVDLDKWRTNFTGIQFLHAPTNFLVTGAIDDLWIKTTPSSPPSKGGDSQGEYIVVDYKATSKDEDITALNQAWQGGYKRQMEIYQWLLRRNGYTVSDTGYFVYCNGRTDREAFDAKLEFDISVIPYKGDDYWVDEALKNARKCLSAAKIPAATSRCDYCAYFDARVKEVMSD
ncbi:MAG: PD-(D/E)XK nuclease family protein [bacterium]|nr:PD-(D/E)XK nuclease family protein [bacterium]